MSEEKLQTRRDLCLALAALGGLAALPAATEAQSPAPKIESGTESGTEPKLIHSRLFPYDAMPVSNYANGGNGRAVVHGTLATGEFVEVHETMLPAGQMPHPPHRHTHSEFLMIRDGRLEVNSDGVQGVVQSGDVVFTASGVLHGLKNIGDTPAHYFVVAVGIQKML